MSTEPVQSRIVKICLYGPESVGKTTLARQLAADFKTVFVPEVSREMVSTNDFSREDIIQIGYAQTAAVEAAEQQANRILFCDTDLITTQIYSAVYLNEIPPILYELEKRIQYDQYVLLDIDVPWIADGLRDLGERRQEMMDRFRNELEQRSIRYTLVSGSFPERIETVRQIANKFLQIG
jgi:NadR type nicotinamide-nucleotide adenylyltransferase